MSRFKAILPNQHRWLAIFTFIFCTPLLQANADVIYISKTASGANNGSSWINAFTSITPAITAATAGDEIWVAATGTYYENIILKADVSLYGGFQGDEAAREQRDWNTYQTIIDGSGSGHVVEGAEGAVLDGFTIQNGSVTGSFPNDCGGGILTYQISMEIANCLIQNNTTDNAGGGLFLYQGSPVIRNCTINNNTAVSPGTIGGLYGYDSDCIIEGCTITNNTNRAVSLNSYAVMRNSLIDGNPAGGVTCSGYAQIINCTISNNTGATHGGGIYGAPSLVSNCTIQGNNSTNSAGGMFITDTNVTVIDCWFESNSSNAGGAIRCNSVSPTIRRCVFVGNSASYAGGALYFDNSSASISRCTFYNNTAVNQGGAVVAWTTAPTINTSILWANSPDQLSGAVTVTYSDVQGGYSGTGNINQDPLFVNAGTKDFHLQSGSPCIDTGDPGLSQDPDATRADMGAYYYPQAPPPTISVTPTSFSPTITEGQNAPDDTFQVSNSGGGILNYSISDNSGWLSVSPTSGDSTGEPDPITITYSMSALTPGSYSATITVSDHFATNNPQTISVSLTVIPPTPEISVNPTSLNPVTIEGNDATSETFTVSNSGAGTLNYSITDDAAWLSVSPTSGDSTGEADPINVIYDTDSLSTGIHNAIITVSDSAANNDPTTMPVTLTVNPAIPIISVTPPNLSVIIIEGQNAPSDTFEVRNIGDGTLDYAITDDVAWLSVSPESGTSNGEPDTITVNYNTASLSSGNYSATITVSDPAASNSPITMPVSLTVNPPPPEITLNPTILSPVTIESHNPSDDTFTVTNTGGLTLNYSITDNATWLTVNPTSGSSTTEADTITVSYSTAAMSQGTYAAAITVSDPAASNNPQNVSVNLTINDWLPEIHLSPTSLSSTITEGQSLGDQSFQVSNPGGGTLNYTITDDVPWLSVDPTSGNATSEVDTITVSYNTSSLPVGTHNGTITVSDPGASNSPQYLAVTVTVHAQLTITTTSLPNGTMGSAYSATLTASGGLPPYTWNIPSGNLPPSLSLNSSIGGISGTPTAAGTFSFLARVRDALSRDTLKWLSISVASNNGCIYVNANVPSATFNLSGPMNYSGSVSWSTSSAPPGTYNCSWNPITGYTTPSGQTKTLSTGGSISFYGTYTVQSATITGRVTDSSNGSGISGAFVCISLGGYQTYTDTGGYYTLVVSAGTHSVKATKSGYNTETSTVSISAGQTKTLNFALNPVPTAGTINGKVTNSATGDPIVNALVITTPNSYQTYTDSSGDYSLTGVAAGTYTVTASKSGFASVSQYSVVVTAGSTLTKNFSLVDNALPSGYITQPTDGQVTNSNNISISASASCEQSGVEWVRFYLHHGPEQGNNTSWSYDGFWWYKTDYAYPYSVSWNHSGLPDRQLTLTIMVRSRAGNTYVQPSSERVSIMVDRTQPETTILSGPPATVNSPNVWFNWTGSDNMTATDYLVYSYKLDSGSWSPWVSNLTKSYSVSIGSHTFYVKAKDLAGNEDPTPASHSFSYSIAPTTGEIHGHVIDAGTLNRPVIYARVLASGTSGNYLDHTDSSGDYSLSNLPSGTYTLTVSHNNYDSEQRTVNLAPTEIRTEDFALTKKVSYNRVRVTLDSNPGQIPVEDAEVKIIYPYGIQIDKTDAQGYVSPTLKLEPGVKIHANKCLNDDYWWENKYRKKIPTTMEMYELWMDSDIIDENIGNYRFYKVESLCEQIVPLVHPVFKWNLFVKTQRSLDDQYYAASVAQKFREMSKELYNTTDGYMMLNEIHLYNPGTSGYSQDPVRDYLITMYDASKSVMGARPFTSYGQNLSLKFKWGIEVAPTPVPGDPNALTGNTYVVVYNDSKPKDYLHEFGHYALSFGDEYVSYKDAQPLQRGDRHPENYGLMDNHAKYSEMSSQNDYLLNFQGYLNYETDVTGHLGWYMRCIRANHESCWDTFKEKFGKPEYGHNPTFPWEVPLYQFIKPPRAGNGYQSSHPEYSTDYDRKATFDSVGSKMVVFVNGNSWNGGSLSSASSNNYYQTTLPKTGFKKHGPIRAEFKNGISSALISITQQQILVQNNYSSPFGILCSVALDDITSNILVTAKSSVPLESPPSIIFMDDDTPAMETVFMANTGMPNEYSGLLSIRPNLESGTLEINATDTEGNTDTSIGGLRLNHMYTTVPTIARSREGFEVLYVPVESAAEGKQMAIFTSEAAAISPKDPSIIQVSNPISVQVTTSTVTFDSRAYLRIPYGESLIKGKDESTAKIYCWNDLTEDWDVMTTSTIYPETNVVSSQIDSTGIYAVFAEESDDITTPSAVTDLTATPIAGTNKIVLSWSAPGDDGTSGTAYSYEFRFSEEPITTTSWEIATSLRINITPSIAGSLENVDCWMGAFDEQYYFAMIAKDEASNASPISNCASATTSIVDEDSDGMPDNFENAYSLIIGINDSDDDPDTDTLTNIQEYQYETSPRSADTDGDGLSDFDEISLYKTDPNQWDSDGGGESDSAELSVDRDPWNPNDDDMPPSAPVDLNATRGDGFIGLTWPPHGEPDVIGYEIYYGTSSGGYIDSIYVGDTNSYTLTSVSNDVTYYITYTAHDDAGKESTYAPEVSVSPVTPTPTPTPTPTTFVTQYAFDTNLEGWSFAPLSAPGFSGASSSYSGGRIGISSANDTTSRVGMWIGPTEIPYISGNVYRATYLVSSSQATPAQNPQFRMRWIQDQSLESATLVVNAAGSYTNSLPTDPTTGTYTCYFAPILSYDLGIAFDMLDFDVGQYGTHYVDQIVVERFPRPSTSTVVRTYSDDSEFANWQFLTNIGYGPVTSEGTSTGILGLTSQIPDTANFGFWQSSGTANELTYMQDNLYRATYTLRCGSESARNAMPQVRLRCQNEDGQMTHTMELNSQGVGPGAMPEVWGTEYELYWETPILPSSPSTTEDGFIVTMDLLDFDPTKGGTIYMDSVVVDYLEIP